MNCLNLVRITPSLHFISVSGKEIRYIGILSILALALVLSHLGPQALASSKASFTNMLNNNNSQTNSTSYPVFLSSSNSTLTTNSSFSQISASANGTQIANSSTSTASFIVITYDLPTAAVVTFVLVLLGLTAGLLLIVRVNLGEIPDSD